MNQPSLFSFVLQTYSTYLSTTSPGGAIRRIGFNDYHFSERGLSCKNYSARCDAQSTAII